MSRYPRVVTQRMWSAIRGGRGASPAYRLMRRDPDSSGADTWTAVSVFGSPVEANAALDQAVASGEGDLDDYRVEQRVLPARHWFRPSTWTNSSAA